MDHHYVPQFYLRRWADPDGRIPNYRLIRGRAVFGHIPSTKGTGYETDLYAREHVSPDQRHLVEESFFQVLDTKASAIHARLERMERFTFTANERTDWAMFLAAATARTPDMIRWLKRHAAETLRERLDEKPEEFEQAYGSPPPVTLREWTEQNAPDQIANFGLRLLLKHLTDETLIQTFMNMEWTVHPIPDQQKEILTCDNPLWHIGRPPDPHFTVMLPLSPRRVFIAAKTTQVADDLKHLPPRQLVRRINESVFNRAVERVYGRTAIEYATKLFRQSRRNRALSTSSPQASP